MTLHTSRNYPCIDDTAAQMPLRSRLYHLAPIGVKTPCVESLTSYISRLSEAHGVSPGTLANREIGPLTRMAYPSLSSEVVPSLNGVETTAIDCVNTLASLTLRTNLHCLTLLPWRDVISPLGLLRSVHAWCSACYQDWNERGQPVYDPLIWSLKAVKICPYHHQTLCEICSHCRRQLPVLSHRSRPGHCPRCLHWLGLSSTTSTGPMTDDHMEDQLWVTSVLGELIAASPNLPSPPGLRAFSNAIGYYVHALGGGIYTNLGRLVGTPSTTIMRWATAQCRPKMDQVLALSRALGISIMQFLNQETVQTSAIKTPKRLKRPIDRPGSQIDSTDIRVTLEKTLNNNEYPPPSLRQIAAAIGRSHSLLVHQHPDLCQLIANRYATYRKQRKEERVRDLQSRVRKVTLAVHEQGLFPSVRRVAALLGKAGYIRDPVARQTLDEVRRELGLNTDPQRTDNLGTKQE